MHLASVFIFIKIYDFRLSTTCWISGIKFELYFHIGSFVLLPDHYAVLVYPLYSAHICYMDVLVVPCRCPRFNTFRSFYYCFFSVPYFSPIIHSHALLWEMRSAQKHKSIIHLAGTVKSVYCVNCNNNCKWNCSGWKRLYARASQTHTKKEYGSNEQNWVMSVSKRVCVCVCPCAMPGYCCHCEAARVIQMGT